MKTLDEHYTTAGAVHDNGGSDVRNAMYKSEATRLVLIAGKTPVILFFKKGNDMVRGKGKAEERCEVVDLKKLFITIGESKQHSIELTPLTKVTLQQPDNSVPSALPITAKHPLKKGSTIYGGVTAAKHADAWKQGGALTMPLTPITTDKHRPQLATIKLEGARPPEEFFDVASQLAKTFPDARLAVRHFSILIMWPRAFATAEELNNLKRNDKRISDVIPHVRDAITKPDTDDNTAAAVPTSDGTKMGVPKEVYENPMAVLLRASRPTVQEDLDSIKDFFSLQLLHHATYHGTEQILFAARTPEEAKTLHGTYVGDGADYVLLPPSCL